MKKITFFTFLFFCLFATVNLFALTVHISGTVTTDSTGAPIANHEISVFADSTNSNGFYYYTSVMTNQNGFYEVNVPNVPDTGGVTEFHVRTMDCMNALHDVVVYSNNTPITVNFVICNSTPSGCHASFTYDGDSTSNLTFHFYDTSTHTGDITSRTWDFGDGSPEAPTGDPWHTYITSGTFTVCLTIHTSLGCTDHICQNVTAGNGEGCHASFVDYPDSAPNQTTVHFISSSTGNYTSLLWNFGDPGSGVNNTDRKST